MASAVLDPSPKGPPRLPVLTVARLVCRECLGSRGVGALEHIVRCIDGLLDCFSGPGAVTRACKRGASTRALSYLAARDPESFWKEAASLAATCGHVHVVQWLSEVHPDRCEWGPAVMNGAALCGHLSVVQWLHEHRSEGCTVHAMDSAARNGDFAMVQWLHKHRSEGCTRGAMDWAAAAGDLTLIKWLHCHRNEGCSTRAMDWAAAAGHLKTVQWLHDNRIEGDAGRALRAAASTGQLEVVRWLHAARGKGQCDDMDSQAAYEIAALHDHVAVAGWLQENRGGDRENWCAELQGASPNRNMGESRHHFAFGCPVPCILQFIRRGCGNQTHG